MQKERVIPITSVTSTPRMRAEVYGISARIPRSIFGGQTELQHIAAPSGITRLYLPKLWQIQRRIINTNDPLKWALCGSGGNGTVGLYISRDNCHGALLQPEEGSAVMLITRDCPTVVITDPQTGKILVLHVGRDQLHTIPPPRTCTPACPIGDSIIEAGMKAWSANPRTLHVDMLCGIGAANFPNRWKHPENGDFYRKVTQYLTGKYGSGAVVGDPEEGHLDLPYIIRAALERLGVPGEHIRHDGLDTFAHPECASARRDNGGHYRNGVLVRCV